MSAASLSIVVPVEGKCVNDCAFCVSKMRENKVENLIGKPTLHSDLNTKDYLKRLEYARSVGCNTLLITGSTEPQQNLYFLEKLGFLLDKMKNPFTKIEFQTTGTGMKSDWFYFLRHTLGVDTIALSVSSFSDKTNNEIINTRDKVNFGFGKAQSGRINLKEICEEIKKQRFNLRLSVNLTEDFEKMSPKNILEYAENVLKADQITFRVLYQSSTRESEWTKEDFWIEKHGLKEDKIKEIQKYVYENGIFDRILDFGQLVYLINGMSTVIDDDCMDSKKFREIGEEMSNLEIQDLSKILRKELDRKVIKSLILRPNNKLYSNWATLVPYH